MPEFQVSPGVLMPTKLLCEKQSLIIQQRLCCRHGVFEEPRWIRSSSTADQTAKFLMQKVVKTRDFSTSAEPLPVGKPTTK